MIGLVGRARLRMVGWSILVLGLILAVTGVVLYVSLERALMSSVDVELKSASESARNELVEAGGTGDLQREGYQAGMLYLVIASDGSVASNPQQIDMGTLPPNLLETRSDAFQSADIGAQTTRFYAQRVDEPGRDSVVLVVGRSLEPEQAAAQQLLLTLIVCAVIGLVLSFAGAWFLAARALVPVEQAFQRQQEFVADASHELRTPLTILHSAADMLANDPAQPNPPLVLELREEIMRMERLTRDLLTLARSDRGELQLSLGRVDLGLFARDLATRVGILASARGIRLETCVADTPVVIEADPDRLQQVGLIVLDNALNHTPPGGTITIRAEQRDGEAILEIADTGEGIPEEHLARVFDRFHRVDASRARRTGGAGLGLAIARTLVNAHGGDIAIAVRHPGGTRVTIRLPGLTSEPEPVEDRAASATAGR
jgi:two-component system, OmpR family, sensor histidine kinase CiaH